MSTKTLSKKDNYVPGNLNEVVTPDMVALTRWFKSPYVGVVNFNVRKQIS